VPLGPALRRLLAILILAVLALPFATACLADESLRCPPAGNLIQVGDDSAKVQRKCGPPAAREPVVEDHCTDQGHCTRWFGERWTYDFGKSYFLRYLLFWNGRLAQVEEGEYGSKP
jgi:hypothetical protein